MTKISNGSRLERIRGLVGGLVVCISVAFSSGAASADQRIILEESGFKYDTEAARLQTVRSRFDTPIFEVDSDLAATPFGKTASVFGMLEYFRFGQDDLPQVPPVPFGNLTLMEGAERTFQLPPFNNIQFFEIPNAADLFGSNDFGVRGPQYVVQATHIPTSQTYIFGLTPLNTGHQLDGVPHWTSTRYINFYHFNWNNSGVEDYGIENLLNGEDAADQYLMRHERVSVMSGRLSGGTKQRFFSIRVLPLENNTEAFSELLDGYQQISLVNRELMAIRQDIIDQQEAARLAEVRFPQAVVDASNRELLRDCNKVRAVFGGNPTFAAMVSSFSVRQNQCVTSNGIVEMWIGVDRVFNTNCTGPALQQTCNFYLGFSCRMSTTIANDDRLNNAICQTIRQLRQPATAIISDTGGDSVTMRDFEMLR